MKQAILAVSFGTSYPDTLEQTIAATERALAASFPDWEVRRAFTSGMIIRNSVILIDQIQKHMEAGEAPLDAIIDSAVLRFRPIMLTAAAAILGMLPLMTSTFWGPMAVAIASGLLAATILTLLVLPVMYAAAYGVSR